jgi:hypothetical protein
MVVMINFPGVVLKAPALLSVSFAMDNIHG